jgi:transcriptional regulator with XRE-family HTH domain
MDQIIASNIKRLRKMRGLSQEGLAERADLNPTHLSQIETCRRKPRQDTLMALSKALGVQTKVLHMDYSETLKPSPEDALAVMTEAVEITTLLGPEVVAALTASTLNEDELTFIRDQIIGMLTEAAKDGSAIEGDTTQEKNQLPKKPAKA